MLCVPIVKQMKVVGALYLENHLTPNVFTSERVAVLELLASQAAISLEHARLYTQLAGENRERFAESLVNRRAAASRIGRVETRQIVMHQRGAMQQFKRGARGFRRRRMILTASRRNAVT